MEHLSEQASPESPFEGDQHHNLPPLYSPQLGVAAPAKRTGPARLLKSIMPLSSLVASMVVYAWIFNWELSLGIIALLFIHEIGHYLVIRAKGLPASLPIFIPLVGAYVAMRRMPASVRDEAEIAVAGPAMGALSAIVCFLLFQWTQEPNLLLLARLAFLLNLINLIPVAPLDGGRIVGAISRWIWVLGLLLIAVGFFYLNDPVMRLVLLVLGWLGFVQLRSRFGRGGAGLGASYYRIAFPLRIYIALLYFGLIASLVLGFLATLPAPGPLQSIIHLTMLHLTR
jgi:Zn-dependent protease